MMLGLLLACAPLVSPITMSAIVAQESGGAPWVIHDNADGRVYRLGSKRAAALEATGLISAGHSVDLGLAQVNSANLGSLGYSVEQILDPCTNLAASAKILTDGYRKTGTLPAALSMYNTGRPDSARGRGYTQAVYRKAGAELVVPAIPGGRLADLPALEVATEATARRAGTARATPRPAPQASAFSPAWR